MKPAVNDDLRRIFAAGVRRVDPDTLIRSTLSRKGGFLQITAEGRERVIDLDAFKQVLVIGAGKATARMARALEAVLGERITGGIISVKYGHTEPLARIRTIEADHPVPDAEGERAAREMAALARGADADTLVLTLISGGGSALMPYPAEYGDGERAVRISLAEKQAVTRLLLACGATINEINCVRKHLSLIKGGRLAEMLFPATVVSLILSDVVGDSLDVIASGPTTGDSTTFADVAAIMAKYDLAGKLPDAVRTVIDFGLSGDVPDTPDGGHPAFAKVDNLVIGTNFLGLQAAAGKARDLGYTTVVLSSQVIGEAREVARVLCGIAKDAKKRGLLGALPLCVICGGETTVTIRGDGTGGRNQEMALAFLVEMALSPVDTAGIHFLAASTDGGDGPTDAAGAFAHHGILKAAAQAGLSPTGFLKNNDAYHFFERVGGLLKTGPTNTNVCDIQAIIIHD
ncbi:MAG: glycerate kinase [Pseudomonadota bacterium]